jgi:hypothetical protein
MTMWAAGKIANLPWAGYRIIEIGGVTLTASPSAIPLTPFPVVSTMPEASSPSREGSCGVSM